MNDLKSYASTTADGGRTPLTDTSSPISGFAFNDIHRVATNNLSIHLCPEFRLDEYLVNGTSDLVCFNYNLLQGWLGSNRIVFFPSEDETTTLMVISPISYVPPCVSVNGFQFFFVRSHNSLPKQFLQYILINECVEISKNTYISSLVLPPCGIRSIAVSGFRIAPVSDGLISIDSITKILSPPKIANQSLSRGTRVFTIYNNQVYTVKKLDFEKSPKDLFFDKKSKNLKSFANHVASQYPGFVARKLDSHMVEVFVENRSETCLLIPEFLSLIQSSKSAVSVPNVSERFTVIDELLENISPKWKEALVLNRIYLNRETGLSRKSEENIPWGLIYEEIDYEIIRELIFKLGISFRYVCKAKSETEMNHILEQVDKRIHVLIIVKDRNRYLDIKRRAIFDFHLETKFIKSDTLMNLNFAKVESIKSQMVGQKKSVFCLHVHLNANSFLYVLAGRTTRVITSTRLDYACLMNMVDVRDNICILIGDNNDSLVEYLSEKKFILLSLNTNPDIRINGTGIFTKNSNSFFVVSHTRPCEYTVLHNAERIPIEWIAQRVFCKEYRLPKVVRNVKKCIALAKSHVPLSNV